MNNPNQQNPNQKPGQQQQGNQPGQPQQGGQPGKPGQQQQGGNQRRVSSRSGRSSSVGPAVRTDR